MPYSTKESVRQRKRHADRKVGCAEGDRRAEAQLDKGMSQTKVKSRMYASKLLTERSPVVKRVKVAETNTDAADSFCAAPGGTGHRDMARSESSARELGRPVPAQARGQESDGAVVAVKRVMTVERRVPACMAFQTETAERAWPTRPITRKGERPCVRKRTMAGAMHRARPWEKLTAKADAGTRVRPCEITEGQVRMEGRLREEMRGRRQGRGRRAAASRKDKLVEFGIDTKNLL